MPLIANLSTQNLREKYPLLWILITNLIPVAGVLYAGWNVYEIVLMYWWETLVIGLFCLISLIISNAEKNLLVRGGFAVFFFVHFGLFSAIQGLFIFIMLKGDHIDHAQSLQYGVLILFFNYLIHFFNDYIFSGKYKSRESPSLFGVYGRIVIQQFVILIGGYITTKTAMSSDIRMLTLLIALKTSVDLGVYFLQKKSTIKTAEIQNHDR
ncbi:MAG: DUF6498-containing protein [Cytophagaceae bacterium]